MTLDLDRPTIEKLCKKLADDYSYNRRGVRIIRLDTCWQMVSAPEYAASVRKAFEVRKPARLSQSALEVLTIIAYHQPTTKAYVDQMRGVDSSYTVSLLADRELIEECGRMAVPGRPILYRTTRTFLRSFGLSSLEELPELPNASSEDQQMTLNMQQQVEALQKVQSDPENISDDELLSAARELAGQEVRDEPTKDGGT